MCSTITAVTTQTSVHSVFHYNPPAPTPPPTLFSWNMEAENKPSVINTATRRASGKGASWQVGGELAGLVVGGGGVVTHKLFWCAIIFALWNEPPVVHLACRNIHIVIFKLLQDITTEYVWMHTKDMKILEGWLRDRGSCFLATSESWCFAPWAPKLLGSMRE